MTQTMTAPESAFLILAAIATIGTAFLVIMILVEIGLTLADLYLDWQQDRKHKRGEE